MSPVILSAEGSTDDYMIDNVTWDLGDGSTANTMVVSHGYIEPGLYMVTLTVTDARGQFDIDRTTVEVVNLAPEIVDIDVPKKARVGENVTFSVNANDPDGQVAEIGWDFDASNGITFEATGTTVAFEFKEAGTYNITCIVRDDDGGQRVVHFDVDVEGDQGLVPGFQMSLVLLALLGAILISRILARPSGVKDLYQSGYKRE
jgi:immune inhibitor A